MKIIVSGRNIQVTDAIRTYAEEKISRVKKYFEHIIEIDITLSVEHSKSEGDIHKADVLLFGNGAKIKVTMEDKDLYAAIDKATDILERQVRKHKEKLKEKKKKGSH